MGGDGPQQRADVHNFAGVSFQQQGQQLLGHPQWPNHIHIQHLQALCRVPAGQHRCCLTDSSIAASICAQAPCRTFRLCAAVQHAVAAYTKAKVVAEAAFSAVHVHTQQATAGSLRRLCIKCYTARWAATSGRSHFFGLDVDILLNPRVVQQSICRHYVRLIRAQT